MSCEYLNITLNITWVNRGKYTEIYLKLDEIYVYTVN